MTSLTPNEDAYRAASQQPDQRLQAQIAKPGVAGVSARITSSVINALSLAIVQELDRASAAQDIAAGCTTAAANIIAMAARNFGLNSTGLCRHVAGMVQAAERGDVPTSASRTIDITSVPRA